MCFPKFVDLIFVIVCMKKERKVNTLGPTKFCENLPLPRKSDKKFLNIICPTKKYSILHFQATFHVLKSLTSN